MLCSGNTGNIVSMLILRRSISCYHWPNKTWCNTGDSQSCWMICLTWSNSFGSSVIHFLSMVYQFGEDFWGHSHRLNPAFWNVCQQAVVNYLNIQILDRQVNQTDTQTQLSPPLPHSRILKIGKHSISTFFSAQPVFCVISSASYFNARFDLMDGWKCIIISFSGKKKNCRTRSILIHFSIRKQEQLYKQSVLLDAIS